MEIEYIALEEVTVGKIVFRPGASLPKGWDYQGLIDCNKVKCIVTKITISIPKKKPKVKKKYGKRHYKGSR